MRCVITLVGILSLLTSTQAALAADMEVRLVAADRKDRPLVSDLVDFRRSPDGGLIATQWISGVQLGTDPLFPIIYQGGAVPDAPKIAGTGNTAKLKDSSDSLLDDIKKEAEAGKVIKVRPVDVVDPQYIDKKLSDGRTVGPQRTRLSKAILKSPASGKVTPSQVSINSRTRTVEVPCYPVTITAAAPSAYGYVAFVPKLIWRGRDLLADCLFEHSPDLPLGDFGLNNPDSLQSRLAALRGGNRQFRRLTIYLPANAKQGGAPYMLNGRAFTVSPEGVQTAQRNSEEMGLKVRGKFIIELQPSSAPGLQFAVPVISSLSSGWTADAQDIVKVAADSRRIEVKLTSPKATSKIATFLLPKSGDAEGHWHPYLLLSMDSAGKQAAAHYLRIRSADERRGGRLEVQISEPESRTGAESKLGTSLEASLELLVEQVGAKGVAKHSLTLSRISRSNTWTASPDGVPTGLYGLKIKLPTGISPAVPVVVAQDDTVGSLSLLTYHNRRDYRRGEQVQLGVVVRAVDAIEAVSASVYLQHETGELIDAGQVALNCPAGQARSVFLPIETEGLRTGRYEVSIRSSSKWVEYPAWFTVYPATPRSTFALYSWMIGSFSGPMIADDQVLTNVMLSQRPSQFLTPTQLTRYTSQGTFDAKYAANFGQDSLFPAPEACLTYDKETEREAATAMRLGIQYCPDYGWGMNGQEAAWNPKHTLPEELDRVARVCSQVTQRHRDFGNFGGLHLNWYPRIRTHWEQHPNTDGNAGPRREMLSKQIAEVYKETEADRKSSRPGVDRAVRAAKYRIGSLPRAYDAWTERAKTLRTGLTQRSTSLQESDHQPGLTGQPVYTSFLPVSWFNQHTYYPPVYFSKLPVASVHAYTDYGFSPFQPLWAIDRWAAGVGDKPVWMTTMSNGRDVMIRHALLGAGRGADGIDINGQDPTTAKVISEFLAAYGPTFRTLQPESDVAIVTSLGQQTTQGKPEGVWMGYTGGPYYTLYTKLWYAGRPPKMLPEETVTLERLQQFKAVFLVHQKTPFPPSTVKALKEYVAAGGTVFKDAETSADLPGELFGLQAIAGKQSPGQLPWQPDKYRETRDRFFVGTHASYEAVAGQLRDLLKPLGLPRVTSTSKNVMLASLGGDDVSVVFAVNDARPWPGIHHPWNFWSATVMAQNATLSFDQPYVVYDLLEGGTERRAQPAEGDRFTLPVSFDRCAGRAYLLTKSPIRKIRVQAVKETIGGAIPVVAEIIDEQGQVLRNPMPCEITLIDDHDRVVQQVYRALGPGRTQHIKLPTESHSGQWHLRVRELASGRTAQATIKKQESKPRAATSSRALVTRSDEIEQFLSAEKRPLLILLDQAQLEHHGPELKQLAESLMDKLKSQGRLVELMATDPLELIEVPQRWRPNLRDQQYLKEARSGKRVVMAASLHTLHQPGNNGAAGPQDVFHPNSGFTEPGARHRIYRDVILLGSPRRSRYLADLHQTVGQRASENFPTPGSALVQVIHDAFTPRHDCLSIQAHDLAGLEQGVKAALAARPFSSVSTRATVASKQTVEGDQIVSPRNPIRDVFGAAVHPMAFTADGGLLVGAGTQAANYFRFDAQGKLQKKWVGKYALHATESGLWIRDWWGVPGFVDKVIRADVDAQPQWIMDSSRYSRSFRFWRHPGKRSIPATDGDDLFVSGHHQLSRITSEGKVVWRYDDLVTSNDVESFRFSRDVMLHDVSPDGRFLLVAAIGVEPYANLVGKFVRPSVMLFHAPTGKLLWEKKGILIDHSACRFADDKLIVADATPDRKRVMLLDVTGKELRSMSRVEGTSEAALSPDGKWLVVRPETPRGANFQTLGTPKGLAAIEIETGLTRPFNLTGKLHTWRMHGSEGHVLVSSDDGYLRSFRPDTSLVWEQKFNGPCQPLVSPSGDRIVVGTQNGLLLVLDSRGKPLRKIDLMPHNIVQDPDQYVRQYTAAPTNIPILDPMPSAPERIDVRHGKRIRFSDNLFESIASLKALHGEPLKTSSALPGEAKKPGTYVFTVFQRASGGRRSSADERLRVTVREALQTKPLVTAELPLSASWQERTLAWKLPRALDLEVTIEYLGKNSEQGVDLRDTALLHLDFPSANVLAQKLLEGPGDPFSKTKKEDVESLLSESAPVKPPSVRFFMPNDVDLTARSRGAAPFPKTIDFTVPFNGKVTEPKTSWRSKPLSGSTHGILEMKYKTPVTLTSLAVYEDTTEISRYTDTYALFVREVKTGQWRQVGRVISNRNPFNLFTFEPTEIDTVQYLWLKSPDRHARIAELEAYRPRSSLSD